MAKATLRAVLISITKYQVNTQSRPGKATASLSLSLSLFTSRSKLMINFSKTTARYNASAGNKMEPSSISISTSPTRQKQQQQQHKHKQLAHEQKCVVVVDSSSKRASPRRRKSKFFPFQSRDKNPTMDALLNPSASDPTKPTMQREIFFSPNNSNNHLQTESILSSPSPSSLELELESTKQKLKDTIKKQKDAEKNLETAEARITHLCRTVRNLEKSEVELNNRLKQECENEEDDNKAEQNAAETDEETKRLQDETTKSEQETKAREHQQKLEKVAIEQKRQLNHIQYLEKEIESKAQQVQFLQMYIKEQEGKEEEIDVPRSNSSQHDGANDTPNISVDGSKPSNDTCQDLLVHVVVELEDIQLQLHEFNDLIQSFDAWMSKTAICGQQHRDDKTQAMTNDDQQQSRWMMDELAMSIKVLQEGIMKLSTNTKSLRMAHHHHHHHHQQQHLEVEKANHQMSRQIIVYSSPSPTKRCSPPEAAMRSIEPVRKYVPCKSGILSHVDCESVLSGQLGSSSLMTATQSFSTSELPHVQGNRDKSSSNTVTPASSQTSDRGKGTPRRLFPFTTESFILSVSNPTTTTTASDGHGPVASVEENASASATRPPLLRRNASEGILPIDNQSSRQGEINQRSKYTGTGSMEAAILSENSSNNNSNRDDDDTEDDDDDCVDPDCGAMRQQQISLRKSVHHELLRQSLLSFRGRLGSEYFDSTKKPWQQRNRSLNPIARGRRNEELVKPGRSRPDNQLQTIALLSTTEFHRIEEEHEGVDTEDKNAIPSGDLAEGRFLDNEPNLPSGIYGDLSYIRILQEEEANEEDTTVNRIEI